MSVNPHEISVSIAEKVPCTYPLQKSKRVTGWCDKGIEIINEGGLSNITGSSFKLPKNEIIDLIDNIIKTSYDNNLITTKDVKTIIKNINSFLEDEYDIIF